jgi:cobaltochelatase CobN
MNEDVWRFNPACVSLEDLAFYYTSSEIAGMVDPMLITARDSSVGSLQPNASHIQALADKAAAMIPLRHETTSDLERVLCKKRIGYRS